MRFNPSTLIATALENHAQLDVQKAAGYRDPIATRSRPDRDQAVRSARGYNPEKQGVSFATY